ncbi:MAG: hypothetical protein FWG70_10980 [Oscillospiraceae bacterium]|nr:hypothetical protein [Oscillospiraceae bacterium]
MFNDDVALVKMLVKRLSSKHGWNYDETLDRFYDTKVCELISDESTGAYAFAPVVLIDMLEDEWNGTKKSDGWFKQA